MPSDNLVKIILELEDKATEAAKQADEMIKKFGNSAQQSNNKAASSSEQLSTQMRSTNDKINEAARDVRKIGRDGQESFNKLSKSQQDSAIKFNMLDKSAQNVLNHINEFSRSGMPGFSAAVENARSKFDALNNVTHTFSGSLDYARSKLQLLGTDTDSLKGKIQVVGSGITTYIGTKWDGVKSKVSSLASHISSALGNALNTVKTKIQSLGDAFSGLGGIMSSVFGGIGLAAMEQMTLGASINRERIQTLSYAMLGYGESMEQFTKKGEGLWDMMDTMTNKSLVSLDQLSQAASVVKMSTNATKDQMRNLLPVLNDIGQRAILMGKSGDEAMALMQAAGKGLNGEFEMLRENFGITKDKLKEAGWSGSAEDVDGYTKALETCLKQSGDVNGMMDTTHGKLTKLKKMWSVSARSLGDEFKPYVDQALDSVLKFVDANNDGQIDEGAKGWMKYAAGAMTAASAFATIAPSIAPVLQCMQQVWNSAVWVKDKLTNLGETLENMQKKWNNFKDKVQSAKDKLQEFKDKISSSWNEGKLNTIKQKFIEIKDKIVDAKDRLMDFINRMKGIAAEKIDLLKTKFSQLKDKILDAKDRLIDFLSRLKGIVAEKVAGLADRFRSLADSISLAGIKAKLYAAYQWLVNAATAVWNALLDMNPVMIVVIAIMALVAALLYLYNTNDTVKAAIDGLFAALAGVGEWLMGSLVPAFQGLWETLQPIGEFLVSTFAPIWDVIVQVLTIIWDTVTGITDAFNQFMTGQIDLPALLLGIWGLLSQMWIQILQTILTAIWNFASQVLGGAINAGMNFLNGVGTYISQLPGKVWNWLVQTTAKIVAAGIQWAINAKQKASETVNGVISYISQLPGKVYNEFAKIPGKIKEAAVQAIQAASEFGQMLIDAVLNAMGIHSPGIIQNSIKDEFNNTVDKIKDTIKPAGEYAAQLGEEIVDRFGSPELDLKTDDLLPYTDLDADKFSDVSVGFDSAGLQDASSITDSTNMAIGDSYAALTASMTGSLNEMVMADQLAYSDMQNNDLMAFANISNGLSTTLATMGVNLSTQLNLMMLTHQNAMNNANNTTRTQLNSMLNQTVNVTGQMRNAWSVMATSIISAAEKIKTETTNYFNQLSSTIKTFYTKLQNPSQWAGGDSTGSPSTVRRIGRDPATMTRITRNVANGIRRDNQLPYTITAVKAMDNGLVSPVTLEYMNKTASDNINILDLIQHGACPNCLAGGWADVAPPNIQFIKKTAREWDMKGPAVHTGVGDIDTGLSFKVKDFEGGTPNISWESFVRIATAIASAIPYDFYYNSDKYGSWQNAIAAGSWNCFDGASAMVALANTCGYGGYVDCGLSWNGTGHCAAIINGYTFDTTALYNRGGWASGPCNYSHPAPSAGGPINVHIPGGRSTPRTHSNPLEGLFDFGDINLSNDNTGNALRETSVEEVKLEIEHNLNVNLENVPESISEEDLARMIAESANDESFVKRLAQNINFQKYDLKEKLKIDRRNKRDTGVGI